MSYSNRASMIDEPEKKKNQQRVSIAVEDVPSEKVADFETAITAAGTGKYQYLLILSIIPASWASCLDTANMSMIIPSAEKDLGLTLFHKGVLNAAIYIGMVLSGFMWGYLADVKGRKKVILYGYLADAICNILAGLSQNFETLVFFKFLSGFIVSGPHATLMAYCSEFYGTKGRGIIPILVGFSVTFGNVVNAILAWLVVSRQWSIVIGDGAFIYNSWRLFLSLCGVPTLIGVLCLSFFPESPKFLMMQDRNEDALEIFKQMYSMNTGLPKDNYPIQIVSDTNLKKTTELGSSKDNAKDNTKKSFKDGIKQMKPIFFNPYLSRLLLLVSTQFCGLLGLNTFRLWQPQLFATLENFKNLDINITNPTFCEILDISTKFNANTTVSIALEETSSFENIVVSESVYTDSIIISATSCVFILLGSIFVNFLEHKYLAIISYGCAFLCLVAMIWATNTLTVLVLTCLYLGLLNKCYNIIIGIIVLLFPTSLRAMAVSMAMIIGRVGSIIGNLIFPILLEYGCIATIINMACFTSLCVILMCFIPRTSKYAV